MKQTLREKLIEFVTKFPGITKKALIQQFVDLGHLPNSIQASLTVLSQTDKIKICDIDADGTLRRVVYPANWDATQKRIEVSMTPSPAAQEVLKPQDTPATSLPPTQGELVMTPPLQDLLARSQPAQTADLLDQALLPMLQTVRPTLEATLHRMLEDQFTSIDAGPNQVFASIVMSRITDLKHEMTLRLKARLDQLCA